MNVSHLYGKSQKYRSGVNLWFFQEESNDRGEFTFLLG
jgi:hypothetical protein